MPVDLREHTTPGLQHTLRGLAVLTTADQLVEAWGVDWKSL